MHFSPSLLRESIKFLLTFILPILYFLKFNVFLLLCHEFRNHNPLSFDQSIVPISFPSISAFLLHQEYFISCVKLNKSFSLDSYLFRVLKLFDLFPFKINMLNKLVIQESLVRIRNK